MLGLLRVTERVNVKVTGMVRVQGELVSGLVLILQETLMLKERLVWWLQKELVLMG